jgi:hypothetical protein
LKRAWHIGTQVDEETGEERPDQAELGELVADLLATLERVGGQVAVASIREDTGMEIGGVRTFVTTGYIVQYTDRVPGSAAPAAAPEAEPVAEEEE